MGLWRRVAEGSKAIHLRYLLGSDHDLSDRDLASSHSSKINDPDSDDSIGRVVLDIPANDSPSGTDVALGRTGFRKCLL